MNWINKNNQLSAVFNFKDFAQAFAFMTEIAIHAEKMNHHPTWLNTYNKVEIKLSTHDAGNTVTQKDHDLSEIISTIYRKFQ